MSEREFIQLLDKYLEGTASKREKELLFRFYEGFQQSAEWNEAEMGASRATELCLLQRLQEEFAVQKKAKVISGRFLRNPAVAAAVLLLLIGSVAFWWAGNKGDVTSQNAIGTLAPLHVDAVNVVMLTLENGKRIQLNKAPDGMLLKEGNVRLLKQQDKLEYLPDGNRKPANGMHQITTPKGAQFQVVLPDGSSAWLNAATAMRFPAEFSATERKVQVCGEVYFEVKKEAARPFRVYAIGTSANGQEGTMVEVLGTHFNINAYPDEQGTKTTLLEGSVKVSAVKAKQLKNSAPAVLRPGQQALVTSEKQQEKISISNVDAQSAVAWKENLFDFSTADIHTIMRQLARWYDVEVSYENNIAPRSFSGKISRNTDLATVLKILEQSNIRFKVEGRKITVIS